MGTHILYSMPIDIWEHIRYNNIINREQQRRVKTKWKH